MEDREKTWVCEKCGGTVGIGQFPLCKGNYSDHGEWTGAEEPMEAIADEMLTDEPGAATFTSRREMMKFLDKENLQPHTNRDPLPKTARGTGGRMLFFDMHK